MYVGFITAPFNVAKHSLMTVKAQVLAYQDVKMPLPLIMAKTGMSNSALHRLFKAAKSEPATAAAPIAPALAPHPLADCCFPPLT